MQSSLILDEIDYAAEAELDPAITFPYPISPNALSPKGVFLTGGTGFVGAYLIDELLRKTEATVYCIIRAADADHARQRLVRQLQSYELWRDELSPRIQAIPGDLSQPLFGLTENEFLDIASRIDVVYHSAGSVNMALPYARLKAVHVDGTKEVLRFAGAVCTKPVHVLSSIVVFFSDAHPCTEVLHEGAEPRFHPTLRGGYSKSKWVADRLVLEAQSRGLPASIYRPVRIMGHSETGALNDIGDILPLLLKGCILMGKCPAFDIRVTLATVDYVARAMVLLASQRKSWGRGFLFFTPSPIEWRRLMNVIRDQGYPLQEMPYEEWWQDLKRKTRDNGAGDADGKNFFATLLMAMTAPHFIFYNRPPFDISYTLEGLAGSGISCPPFDEALATRYIQYWQKTKILPMSSELTA